RCRCEVKACKDVPETGGRPVQDCRRRGASQRLIPAHLREQIGQREWGQHRRGSDPNLRDRASRHLVRTSKTRLRRNAVSGGRLLRASSCLGSLRVNQAGWLVATGGSRTQRRVNRQTGKSLQWIERQKRSPSAN